MLPSERGDVEKQESRIPIKASKSIFNRDVMIVAANSLHFRFSADLKTFTDKNQFLAVFLEFFSSYWTEAWNRLQEDEYFFGDQ